jgi:ABC-type uncharacterized transport system involved in gliding motility auxiliary subunit
MMLQFAQPDALAQSIKDTGRQTVAAMVTGDFTTAFPEGRPAPPPAEDGGESDPAPAVDNAPGKTSGTGTLVVVADADWLMDSYSVRRYNFLGVQAAEPINDNLAFASNLIEFMAGSKDLISIRTKGSSQHPFTVVRDMEADAQQRYQQQLEALEGRLSDVQRQLTELQSQVGDGGMLVASPEVADAIAEFQAQEAEMRRERRDIRRALREDIDALETKLVLINLFAGPLCIGAFGLWFRQRRRHA